VRSIQVTIAIRSSWRVAQASAVEDVLLQQREETLHGRVVAGRTDPAHGTDQAMTCDNGHELP
jgi:hypothetical protein